MLPLISEIALCLIVAVLLAKLLFMGYYGLHKNNQVVEHSLLFMFSKDSIKNSFYRPLTKYMRISNRLTIVFYILLLIFGGTKFFEMLIQ